MGTQEVWIAVLVGALGTFIWRVLGVGVAKRVAPDSALFMWIGCVAYALVAGLMARVLLMPGGDTSVEPMIWRGAAFAFGLAVWYWRGKSVPLGLLAGVSAYTLIVVAEL